MCRARWVVGRRSPLTCRSDTKIIAVDILPIRSFKAKPPTLRHCSVMYDGQMQSDGIQHALAKILSRVVLHDGAPNVGADYGGTRTEQNRIALHASSVPHCSVVRGGTFITKIYRSRDYAAFFLAPPTIVWGGAGL
jgi:AdoMet-dependent rRNA methyltransferase SPB1